MEKEPIFCIVWLEWPERCFRADAKSIKHLESLVPPGSTVMRVTTEASFLRSLPKATHVIVWSFKKEWYALAPKLKLVATPGAGRELVAYKEAPPGVNVHFGGFHGSIMAESVAAFILAWSRGFFTVYRERMAGRGIWPRERFSACMKTVAGTKAVIAGYGKVGRAIGEKLEALGVHVQGFGRKNIAGIKTAVRNADWFIMALPGDTGTDDFLNHALLIKLPPKCVVINVGRGNAVDERSLAKELRKGTIAGAYLDVFKDEPTVLNPNPPEVNFPLWDPSETKVVAMPHSSAFAPEYVVKCFEELHDEGLV